MFYLDAVWDAQDEGSSWTEAEVKDSKPAARGWYAAAALPDGMVIHGGNALDNSRLADLLVLQI